ncbi:hypothetical protein TNCV_4406501 [Trichonephila clavipes]|nr:hypothetical protein TNCV_4406501 [Trichonephila clavipes]
MKIFKHVHKTDIEKRYIENSQFNIVSIEKERGFQLPLIETIKHCAFKRNTTTPVTHLVIPSKICHDSDFQTPSAVKPKLIFEYKENNYIPKVYSEFVFKICGALVIETQLASMEKNSPWIGKLNRKSKKNPPVVRSVIVYKICVALNLSAQLCAVTSSNASICNTQQKPKTKKNLPKVHSAFIFNICRALDLEAALASP